MVSHYRVLGKLGAGGMGEVYLAEDTTLKRRVALKVLPPELAASQDRLERFQREAETLAALDHPNIVHIYTVEDAEGVRFLTMQLVEGKRLSDLIPKSGMPLERIFEVAIPLADALAAAHEKGVIHRDLKPGNIMVADEGRVKVLDFGLAKLRPELDVREATSLPTEPLTDEGRILGTVPYMSPEQLEGRQVDARTDIFSLGVILYEMATGERPFKGDSSVSIISSIMKDTPREVDTLRADLPHHLARIIRHCLEKDPERRFQTAKELRNELEDLKTETDSGELRRHSGPLPKVSRRRTTAWIWSVVGVLTLALAIVMSYRLLSPGTDLPRDKSALTTAAFTQLTIDPDLEQYPSLAPDGTFFVYASNADGDFDIYLRRIEGGRAINLTEDCTEDDVQPAYSPDGRQIAFRSERDGGGLFVMGATGESVRQLTDTGFVPSWSPDGSRISFASDRNPMGVRRWSDIQYQRTSIVDVGSGEISELVDASALEPDWSPHGHRIAFSGATGGSGMGIFSVAPGGGDLLPVTDGAHFDDEPVWSPDGRHIFFVSDRSGTWNVWRVAVDEATGRVLGDPEAVTSGTHGDLFGLSLSSDGRRLAYAAARRATSIQGVPFDPVAERVVGEPFLVTPFSLDARDPSVSPDGAWIAFGAFFGEPASKAIGIIRTDGTGLQRLTDLCCRDGHPRWSPDGERIAFWSNRSGSLEAWIMKADGSGLRQLSDSAGLSANPAVWSPDGERLAGATIQEEAYLFEADSPWQERPPTTLPPVDASGKVIFYPWSWSPDGKILAGHTSRWGDCDPPPPGVVLYFIESETYRRLTHGFGHHPVWFLDSRRLLFVSAACGELNDFPLSVLDLETGEHREVVSSQILSLVPETMALWVADIAPDNRTIYFQRRRLEQDIWMLTLGDQE